MTLTIKLSDEQVTALEAKAAAEGLSVEQWIQKLAEEGQSDKSASPRENRTGADLIAALQASPLSRSVIGCPCATLPCNAMAH